jgi:hypothetical protein
MTSSDNERENKALDALVAASLLRARHSDGEDVIRASDVELLSEDERREIRQRGAALIDSVLNGTPIPSASSPPAVHAATPELAGAFFRANDGAELSRKAHAEMRRRRKVADRKRRLKAQ